MISWTPIYMPFGLCLAVMKDGVLAEIRLDIPGRREGADTLREKYGEVREEIDPFCRLFDQLTLYLLEQKVAFDIPVDESWMSPWEKKVFSALRTVPHGEIITYQGLAEKIGSPQSARAVGMAMSRNQIPIVIPCHRVVASDGLGGFSAGLKIKEYLLSLERPSSSKPTLQTL